MNGFRCRCYTIFALLCLLYTTTALAEEYPETEWDALMPAGWEPDYSLMAPQHEFNLESDDPQTFEASNMPAPVVEALSGQKLKLPGYVIPIKYDGTTIEEFLLVPYMGACIHVPPPPENQMVYVVLKEPLVSSGLWDPVWVSGEMKTELSETQYATAGYRMLKATIEPYEY